tara:strand:+ start:210 stop:665 length:456 start_codon:yes stop_codon:yes gene_type:complete
MPLSKPLKASDINVEGGRASNANAPLAGAGASSTAQAGSLIKLYENSGVNQDASYAYSDFDGKSFVSVTGFNCTTTAQSSAGFACLEVSTTTYFFTPTSAGQVYPIAGNNVWTSAAGTTGLPSGWYRMGNFDRFNVNSNGIITNGTVVTCE